MEFCHISPTAYLTPATEDRPFHLVLAHLIESDREYAEFYANLAQSSDTTIILDNSAFEMYKQGRPMYPSDKLIEMGTKVNADYIVMSDYPGEPSTKTIEAAKQIAPELRKAGFGTFFVPQSEVGDLEDLVDACAWASKSDLVDYIGISILGVPNAYGVERDNKLQRFLARWKFMDLLTERGILSDIVDNRKKIHFLGMVDGPNEIMLVKDYLYAIDSWDSSAAIWAGLNGISFDNSPTGLVDGKFEEEVDFNYTGASVDLLASAMDNTKYIDDLINKLCEWDSNVV